MAELNKIRFLLFVLSVIFPTHALDVYISSIDGEFKQKSEIIIDIDNGVKSYGGTISPLTFHTKLGTSRVILYIIDRSRFVEIMRNAVRPIRSHIADELSQRHCELVLLGIENFEPDEYSLIGIFLLHKIIPCQENQPEFIIDTIGEGHFDRFYESYFIQYARYRETPRIFGGSLLARVRSIKRGALGPVGRNGKEIKLYGFHPAVEEVEWPVRVENDTYSLEVDVKNPKYNFRIRSKTIKICLLILGGKEYSAAIRRGERSNVRTEIAETLDIMTGNDEGLVILGAFNFDWTEIDIVTQIILQHSVGLKSSDYNVFACGYGMYNSYYMNDYVPDGRIILQQPKPYVTELIKVLMKGEVRQRTIIMHYRDGNEWKDSEVPINLRNGRYFAAEGFEDYTFPWVNQRIAFIVYEGTAAKDQINLRKLHRSMEDLQRRGLRVVLINASHFGMDDIHIIAQSIDYHSGVNLQNLNRVIDSDEIAVLGAGIFDTIFQSKSTTYKTLFHSMKNELIAIRNTFVYGGNRKRIFAAHIDNVNPKFVVWTYLMNTVNGYYEPDLIPDQHMFGKRNPKKILFIITSANYFKQIRNMSATTPITQLREAIADDYPYREWKVFLVGLDNFEERDYHLFGELVKVQTKDERSLAEFVYTFSYGLGSPLFQYKDTPFCVANSSQIQSDITSFFNENCRNQEASSSNRN